MSIQKVRRSILIAAGIGVLAFTGLFAGRLLGRQMGHGFPRGPRAARMFDHVSQRPRPVRRAAGPDPRPS